MDIGSFQSPKAFAISRGSPPNKKRYDRKVYKDYHAVYSSWVYTTKNDLPKMTG
jgi:hypothetical protein